MKTLTKAIIAVGVFLFFFITAMVVTFWKFQAIPDTLVTAVLASGSTELLLTALIEIFKNKYQQGENANDNISNEQQDV